MKISLPASAFALTLLMTLGGGGLQPADASDWYIGGGFRVGDVHFSLAFDHRHRHPHPYYYRTRQHVRHQGHRCGSYCLRRSGHTYHHASCPLVLHHFRLHGYHPARAWDVYWSPRHDRYYDRGRYYGHRDYGHRDYGYRGRGHRDYYYRDDHRGRGRGHHRGHDRRSCRYR